jgi:hypothetical protein
MNWFLSVPRDALRTVLITGVVAGGGTVIAFLFGSRRIYFHPWEAVALGLVLFLVGVLVANLAPIRFRRRDAEALRRYEEQATHARDAIVQIYLDVLKQIPETHRGTIIEKGVLGPAQRILTVAQGERVRLSIVEENPETPGVFRMAYGAGFMPESQGKFALAMSGSLAGFAIEHRERLYIPDVSNDDRFRPHPMAKPEHAFRTFYAVPLGPNAAPNAVLVADSSRVDAFTVGERAYLNILAAAIDLAKATETRT